MKTILLFILFTSLPILQAQQIQWEKLNGPQSGEIDIIEIGLNDEIYLSTKWGSLIKSPDYGNSWTEISTAGTSDNVVDFKVNSQGWIFAISSYLNWLYVSKDDGQNWTKINSDAGQYYLNGRQLAIKYKDPDNATDNDIIFTKTREFNFQFSPDNGDNWYIPLWEFEFNKYSKIFFDLNGFYYLSQVNNNESYISKDEGNNWDLIEGVAKIVNVLSDSSGIIYLADETDIYKSSKADSIWSKIENDMLTGINLSFEKDRNDNLFLLKERKGIIKSTDGGGSWIAFDDSHSENIYTFFNEDRILKSNVCLDLKISETVSLNWADIYLPVYEYANKLFTLKHSDLIYAETDCNLYYSTDKGLTWFTTAIDSRINVQSMVSTSSGDLYSSVDGTVYHSTDNGFNWDTVWSSNRSDLFLLCDQNDNLYASSASSVKTFRSSDGGSSWQFNLQLAAIDKIAPMGENELFALQSERSTPGIYYSEDKGATWNFIDLTYMEDFQRYSNNFTSLASNNSGSLFLYEYWGGGDGQLYISDDQGLTWSKRMYFYLGKISDILSNRNGELFVSEIDNVIDYWGLVSISNNNGSGWSRIMSGLTNDYVISLHLDNEDFLYARTGIAGYASTRYSGIYRTVLPTKVQQDNKEIPKIFNLSQNYPNPFNPATTIEYSLPADSRQSAVGNSEKTENRKQNSDDRIQNPASSIQHHESVSLKIFDVLGREVATLVNKPQTPGNYKVSFDASKLSSGVYFYRLKYGSFIQSKKMLMIK